MPLVAVLGATGTQGASVATRLLADPTAYQVRALTRRPESAAAQALAARGAQVVRADLNDAGTLGPALAGADALFVVTAYWPSLGPLGRDGAGEEELAQFRNVAIAAAGTPTIRHVVLSTLPGCAAMSGGKLPVPHCDYKQRAAAWIRDAHPGLWARSTQLWVGWYTSNLATVMRPVPVPGSGDTSKSYLLALPSRGDALLPMAGDVGTNVGTLVEAVLRTGPATTGGRPDRRLRHGDATRPRGGRRPHQNHGGRRRVAYAEVSDAHMARLHGDVGAELAAQFRWSEAYPDWHGFAPDQTLGLAELGLEEGGRRGRWWGSRRRSGRSRTKSSSKPILGSSPPSRRMGRTRRRREERR
ncbi:uncharacterized protein PG998_006432 [Apiospora kogelbergensis]|uniref:uncharacterized protein n=1 Tax=Apiospora kogelbergensis TaxID=1337665 RepID=UPI00312FE313